MENLIFSVYDHKTGKTEIREATEKEKNIYEVANQEYLKSQEEAQEKEKVRLSALAKLTKLGLTQEEIDAL